MQELRMAVVGVGHLGKEHARILAGMEGVHLVGVVDANATQAQTIAAKHNTTAYASADELIGKIDAAVVAVPTSLHRQVASTLLRASIPLLIEKPLASSLPEAEELVDLASRQGVAIQVGHIERFNPAFMELKKRPLVPQFIEAERMGVFSGRAMDVGVVLDLMIHDLDLVLNLVNEPVRTVEAVGVSLFGGHEDVAHARLTFEGGAIAQIKASRVSQMPSRQMQCFGAEGFAHLDFAQRQLRLTQPSQRVRGQGIDFRRMSPGQITLVKEQLFTEHLETLELSRKDGDQLTLELRAFVDAVREGTQPVVSGVDGLKAMTVANQILEAIDRHAWSEGATGPRNLLPLSQGSLFESARPAARAA